MAELAEPVALHPEPNMNAKWIIAFACGYSVEMDSATETKRLKAARQTVIHRAVFAVTALVMETKTVRPVLPIAVAAETVVMGIVTGQTNAAKTIVNRIVHPTGLVFVSLGTKNPTWF